MPESTAMLKQKTVELESAVDEVQDELARIPKEQRTAEHDEMTAIVLDAKRWIEARRGEKDHAEGQDAAALTVEAETFLHDIRMRRKTL